MDSPFYWRFKKVSLYGLTTIALAGTCPLWVINGHGGRVSECPLYPRKQTSLKAVVMSAKRQKQTFCTQV
jgi:hypothetical protein